MDLRTPTHKIHVSDEKQPKTIYPVFRELQLLLFDIYQLNNADLDYDTNVITETSQLLELCKQKLATLLDKFMTIIHEKETEIEDELKQMTKTDKLLYNSDFTDTFANLKFLYLDDLIYERDNLYSVNDFLRVNKLFKNMSFKIRVSAFIVYLFFVYNLEPTKQVEKFANEYHIKKWILGLYKLKSDLKRNEHPTKHRSYEQRLPCWNRNYLC